jgi:hypothetical protein
VEDLKTVPESRDLQMQFAKADTAKEFIPDRQPFTIELPLDEAQIIITGKDLQSG